MITSSEKLTGHNGARSQGKMEPEAPARGGTAPGLGSGMAAGEEVVNVTGQCAQHWGLLPRTWDTPAAWVGQRC
jgi:hypothetical protein